MTATILNDQSRSALPERASWAEYEVWRDRLEADDRVQVSFHAGYLWVRDMGWKGLNHTQVKDLFILLLGVWCMGRPGVVGRSMSGCLMEKVDVGGAAPDLMLYVGDGAPQWKDGTKRRISLDEWRVPDLVGEVSDTTLASDLDEMKQLYAALGIPEYWVVNIPGQQVLAFRLVDGKYQECDTSVALPGLPIALLEEVLDRLAGGTNISAASWFMSAIAKL
jgi:Uma2 family endonuclease